MSLVINEAFVKNPRDYSAAPSAPLQQQATIPFDLAGLRLDQALARLFPQHSRNRLQGWLRDGRILLGGHKAYPKDKVWGGEHLTLELSDPEITGREIAEAIDLAVVFEDSAIVVIDKPVGLVVHPGSGNPAGPC